MVEKSLQPWHPAAMSIGMLTACVAAGLSVALVPYSYLLFASVAAAAVVLALFNRQLAMVFLVAAMLLSPEIVIGSLPKRDIVVRVEDILLMVLALRWAGQAAVQKGGLMRRSSISMLILVYTLILAFATARGVLLGDVQLVKGFFYLMKYVEYFFIFYLVLHTVRSKEQAAFYIKAMIGVFLIVNIYASVQIGIMQRVSAPFEGEVGEPNTLGGYQVLLLGIIIGLATHIRHKRGKLLLTVIGFSALVPFIYTQSRASYMAIVPMYLTAIFFNGRRSRNSLIGLMIVLASVSFFVFPATVKQRIGYTFTAQSQEDVPTVRIGRLSLDPSTSARIWSWVRMVQEWRKSPFFGYGLTGRGFVDGEYVRVLVEAGLAGITLFVALLAAIFRIVLRIYRSAQDDWLKGLALGFLAGHVGMMVHALTANTFSIIRIMEPYWFLAALVLLIPVLDKRPDDSSTDEPKAIFREKFNLRNADLLLR